MQNISSCVNQASSVLLLHFPEWRNNICKCVDVICIALHCTNCTNSFYTFMIMNFHLEESKKYNSVSNRGKLQSDCKFHIKE